MTHRGGHPRGTHLGEPRRENPQCTTTRDDPRGSSGAPKWDPRGEPLSGPTPGNPPGPPRRTTPCYPTRGARPVGPPQGDPSGGPPLWEPLVDQIWDSIGDVAQDDLPRVVSHGWSPKCGTTSGVLQVVSTKECPPRRVQHVVPNLVHEVFPQGVPLRRFRRGSPNDVPEWVRQIGSTKRVPPTGSHKGGTPRDVLRGASIGESRVGCTARCVPRVVPRGANHKRPPLIAVHQGGSSMGCPQRKSDMGRLPI